MRWSIENAFEANRLFEESNETTGTRLHKDLNLLPPILIPLKTHVVNFFLFLGIIGSIR